MKKYEFKFLRIAQQAPAAPADGEILIDDGKPTELTPQRVDEEPAKKVEPKVQPSVTTKKQIKSKPKSESNKKIEEMQKAILHFRDVLANTNIGASEVGRKGRGQFIEGVDKSGISFLGAAEGDSSNAGKTFPQEEEVQGMRPFGQFLLSNYIDQSKVKGVTFTDVDMQKPQRMQGQIGSQDNVEFSGIINSLGRVGTPKQDIPARAETLQEKSLREQIQRIDDRKLQSAQSLMKTPAFQSEYKDESDKQKLLQIALIRVDPQYKPIINRLKSQLDALKARLNSAHEKKYTKVETKGEREVDGIWDVRTNNALKNIAAVMTGLITFSKDMNLGLASYNEAQLNAFKKWIPDDPKLIANKEDIKVRLASQFTLHIEAQARFVEEFDKLIVKNPNVQNLLTQNESFFKLEAPKSKEEIEREKQNELKKVQDMQNDQRKQSYDKMPDSYSKRYYSNPEFYSKYQEGAGISFSDPQAGRISLSYQDLSSAKDFIEAYKRHYYKGIKEGEPSKQEIENFFNKVLQMMHYGRGVYEDQSQKAQ
ncbi:MAG: hypothetical protein LC122_12980 [Chitinophagales bacterium]|nr:hypothetical protein [Chitinophagales bacterium]